MYTEQTLLTRGRYKFRRICDVPAEYLLNVFENGNSHHDTELVEYVKANLDKIKAIKDSGLPIATVAAPVKIICTKISFPSQDVAKSAIKRISKYYNIGNAKKPVRAYQCSECTGWHLTSITAEDWKKVNE